MRNYIIVIMTFFASNMTLLLSSKSFIRHSLKSNKDLNVNFSRNFQIGVLSTYFDQPSKLLKSWIIYTHFNFQVILAQPQQTKIYSMCYFLLATQSQISKKTRLPNGHYMTVHKLLPDPQNPPKGSMQCTVSFKMIFKFKNDFFFNLQVFQAQI